jgi:hypothetical protein
VLPDCDNSRGIVRPSTWELMREPNESSGQAVSHDRKTANQDHKANRGQ